MQVMGIRSQIRRKHRFNYASSIGERVAPNILKRDSFTITDYQLKKASHRQTANAAAPIRTPLINPTTGTVLTGLLPAPR